MSQTKNWRETLSDFFIKHHSEILRENHLAMVGNIYSDSPTSNIQFDFRFISVYLPDDNDPVEDKLVFCFSLPLFPSVVSRYYSGTKDHWSDYSHVSIHKDSIISCETETLESVGLDQLHINLKDGTIYSVTLENLS